MKILRLEIEGFRSFRSQSWSPGDLNIVIGPNASGKSNLLRVLNLLQVAARGGLGRHIQQDGGMDAIVWDGRADNVRLKAKMTPQPPYTDPARDALTYELSLARLGTTSAYRIEHELLANYHKVEMGFMEQPFKLLERDAYHAVVFSPALNRFQQLPTETTTTPAPAESKPVAAARNAVSEEETLLSAAGGPFTVNEFVDGFQRDLADWKIHQNFQTHRDAPIRAPQVTRADTQVSADGQNLITVLHSLYTSSRDFKTEVNTAMQSAFGEDFEELIFPPAADQRIQLRVRWKSLQREQSAADLSDGTLRFLFLLAVLANPSPPPLIAIDEPETGLHPSMLPIVAEYARDAAARSQVVLTTHSPELLDSFGDNTPTTTVVQRRQGETMLHVLSGSELEYWLKQYSLGELHRSRELEAMQ